MRVIVSVLTLLTAVNSEQCHKKDYGNGGHVCVCTATHCDTVPPIEHVEPPHFLIYTSNKDGLRFEKKEGTFIKTDKSYNKEIVINPEEKYQTIYGWGGAFTDSTGININSLDEETQEKLLLSYFGETGIEYNLCRVPIGGTDFSERAYSYADGHADTTLAHFRLAPEDFQYKIPFIKKAQELSKGKLEFFASAWTAPKWMKTNNDYSGFAGFLRHEMYQAWADYFVKFLDEYGKEGIKFWGITTGNEPTLGVIPFCKVNSVAWSPTTMGKFVRENLGPTIRNSNHSDIKIIILDDERIFLPWFITIALRNKTTRNYVDGIAVHWYFDGIFPPSLLTKTHDNFPEIFLLGSEAAHKKKLGQKSVCLGSWQRGEAYANDIIQDLLNWVSGWVDWNMVLDVKGGPSYISNFIDSPIIVNATAGEFYKQPMYYNLGHFSKFVPKGSVRIGSSNFDEKVPAVALRRPDNGTVIVILNKKDQVVPVTVFDSLKGTVHLDLSRKSITTILYW